MGLDMYLYGRKFFWRDWQNPENDRKEDGLRIVQMDVDLGYWRKHPNLHGYIVREFAEGVDKCQDIELTKENIVKIMKAVRENRLPPTKGFFFGVSENSEKERQRDLEIFSRALAWLEQVNNPKILEEVEGGDPLSQVGTVYKVNPIDQEETRYLVYRASW